MKPNQIQSNKTLSHYIFKLSKFFFKYLLLIGIQFLIAVIKK